MSLSLSSQASSIKRSLASRTMAATDGEVHLSCRIDDFKNSQCDQYEPLNVIGEGAFSVVHKARDKETGQLVAMKMLLDGLSRSALTELDILKSLPRHPSIVEFKRVAVDKRCRIFMVMEYVENDLEGLMAERKKKTNKPYEVKKIKRVMKQLVEGVKLLHDHGVMHRDLKPGNILMDNRSEVKICDFGCSARFGRGTASYDPNVGTLPYKAPELLAGEQKYTCAVDMWSVGCIMAELVLNRQLFRGECKSTQLAFIKGTAGVSSIMRSSTLKHSGIDLLERLLAMDPERRITAKDALDHPWFKETTSTMDFVRCKIANLCARCNKF